MQERPIIFSGGMVRAILEGRKTQTRRVIQPQPATWGTVKRKPFVHPDWPGLWSPLSDHSEDRACPYGGPGDRLWVRETFGVRADLGRQVEYRASHQEPAERPFGHIYDETTKWRPSIFMPRWASRIVLEVEAVMVERVQEISEMDAHEEGIPYTSEVAVEEFEELWDSINAKRGYGWATNPWVWVIEFSRAGAE